jgi:hypothetical protein
MSDLKRSAKSDSLVSRQAPLIYAILSVCLFIFAVLTIPVISSAEIRSTYVKMIAAETNPTKKENLRIQGEAAIGAQKNREISGFIFISLAGVIGLLSVGSVFIPKKK